MLRVANNEYHEATKHSFLSVQIDPNYVDATTQPSPFKAYPHFFRRFSLGLDDPFHNFLQKTIAITFQKMYREGPYSLRVNPSAGALYPTELYVQIRGIKGLIDGIYHLEVETQSLVLLYELIDDGIEAYFEESCWVKGCIFLVSCVYFRSSWKYKNRSLRYCLLDSGHHLGAIEAAAYAADRSTQLRFDFDHLALNDDLGFENQEFVTAAAMVGEQIDRAVDRQVRRLRSALPFVCGMDYFERNRFIEAGYKNTLPQGKRTVALPPWQLEKQLLLQAITSRRSARRFQSTAITQAEFGLILELLSQSEVEIYAVVQAVTEMEPGIYREGRCLKTGEFREQLGYLCISQAIARDSAVTLFFVSDCQQYQTALQLAGLLGHRVYLAAAALGLGCSGIGAFYDDETKAFLEIEQHVLYAVAIGQLPLKVNRHDQAISASR